MSAHSCNCLHCPHEARALQAEARAIRAEARLEEILGRLRVGIANGRLMERAIVDYFEPPPGSELQAV